ncbi:MAG: serine/threonine protein kinase [Deltaproteobacteria bacterium]|nr:serine/threonine protein kinase [Deltaproteobacteria bacterium]
MPVTIDERFLLAAEVGAGGMGTVHRGRDLTTGAAVAIKIMRGGSPGLEPRFQRETAILAEMAHPCIVRYVASGLTTEGAPFLVMDWIDGEVLDHRLKKVGLTVGETVQVARRVAEALAYAHSRGVVHRDIKPANLIAPDGDLARLMVIDFGVARAQQGTSLTETGASVGTPAYMAPEQVRGERALGPAADVFALGCVLYACLTGRVTFVGKRLLAVHAKIMFWDPPPVDELAPEVPPALAELIARMLAKAPTARPADGAALVALLDALPPMPADGPRRRLSGGAHQTPSTRPSREPMRLVSVVVATSADSLVDDGAPPAVDMSEALRTELEDTLLAHGAAVDVMPDGAVIASLTEADSEPEQARAAVRCALTLRRRFPDAMIGVVTDDVRAADEPELVERVMQALAKDAMATVFADAVASDVPEGGIRLDERTAALVEADFAIVRARGAAFVRRDAGG